MRINVTRRRRGFWMDLLARWIVSTLSIYGVAWLLAPHIQTDDFTSAIWAGLSLGLVNSFVRPLIILLTLPVTVVTLGLFLLVINAGMLLVVSEMVPGFQIESFGWAVLASILISVVSAVLNQLLRE